MSIFPHLLSSKGEKLKAEELDDENIESYIGRKIKLEIKVHLYDLMSSAVP